MLSNWWSMIRAGKGQDRTKWGKEEWAEAIRELREYEKTQRERTKMRAVVCALLATSITATLDWALANWKDLSSLPLATPAGFVEGPVVQERRGRLTGVVYGRRAERPHSSDGRR